jgi:hypothetical protein
MTEHVTLTFDRDEALILFDLLGTLSDEPSVFIRDNADRLTLIRLGGALGNALEEWNLPEYGQILSGARERLNQAWVTPKKRKE